MLFINCKSINLENAAIVISIQRELEKIAELRQNPNWQTPEDQKALDEMEADSKARKAKITGG